MTSPIYFGEIYTQYCIQTTRHITYKNGFKYTLKPINVYQENKNIFQQLLKIRHIQFYTMSGSVLTNLEFNVSNTCILLFAAFCPIFCLLVFNYSRSLPKSQRYVNRPHFEHTKKLQIVLFIRGFCKKSVDRLNIIHACRIIFIYSLKHTKNFCLFNIYLFFVTNKIIFKNCHFLAKFFIFAHLSSSFTICIPSFIQSKLQRLKTVFMRHASRKHA